MPDAYHRHPKTADMEQNSEPSTPGQALLLRQSAVVDARRHVSTPCTDNCSTIFTRTPALPSGINASIHFKICKYNRSRHQRLSKTARGPSHTEELDRGRINANQRPSCC